MSDATAPEPEAPEADGPCMHGQIETGTAYAMLEGAGTGRLELRVEIAARCQLCGEAVRWNLEQAGMHPTQATVADAERTTLRVPAYFPTAPPAELMKARPTLWTPGQPR